MLSTRQATYDYLTKFYAEIHELFPDKFVHVGGDEVCPTPTRAEPEPEPAPEPEPEPTPERCPRCGQVPFDCWTSNPQIQKWMKAQSPPVTSFADLVCAAPSRTPSPWL